MLDTIIGLVLISIIMTPGIPGEVIYSHFSGTDWQERQLRSVVRVVMIRMLGLSVLMMLFHIVGGPAFGYLGLSPAGSLEIPAAIIGLVPWYVERDERITEIGSKLF